MSLRKSVDGFAYDEHTRRWRLGFEGGKCRGGCCGAGGSVRVDAEVVPLLPPSAEGLLNCSRNSWDTFEHSPITGIHLWFDRAITDLDHAVLLDTTIQWMYNKTRLQPQRRSEDAGSYLELVVSASKTLVPMSRQEIIDLALRELAEFFPAVRDGKVVEGRGGERSARDIFCYAGAGSVSAWSSHSVAGNLFGRGLDATGWPSTMEGAVRSGNLAAEALTKAAGKPQKFLQPDLPSQGWMRLFP